MHPQYTAFYGFCKTDNTGFADPGRNKKAHPVGWAFRSPEVIRTPDPVVNSHLLCRLSYRGKTLACKLPVHQAMMKVPDLRKNVKHARYFLVFRSGKYGRCYCCESPAAMRTRSRTSTMIDSYFASIAERLRLSRFMYSLSCSGSRFTVCP